MASVDSIHRDIAEGYCRRTALEYLRFLNIALSSTGESVSGLHACRAADQISAEEFDEADCLAYEVENRLARLAERVAEQRDDGQWSEDFTVREDDAPYGDARDD
jgi:four helix bundle protein